MNDFSFFQFSMDFFVAFTTHKITKLWFTNDNAMVRSDKCQRKQNCTATTKYFENAETMHHQHNFQCRHFFRCKHTLVCFVNSVHLTQRFVGRLKTCKTCVNGRFYQIQRFFTRLVLFREQ